MLHPPVGAIQVPELPGVIVQSATNNTSPYSRVSSFISRRGINIVLSYSYSRTLGSHHVLKFEFDRKSYKYCT